MEEDDLVSAENDTAAAKQLIGNDLALAARLDRVLGNNDGGEPPELDEELDAENVIDAINKLFMLGNENKQTLVDNLIAMGIEASTEDTWGTLLDKILDMTDTSKDTVTAPVLLEGYTAHDSNGDLITGVMVDNAGVTVDAGNTTQDSTYAYLSIPQDGYYDQGSKVRTANSNINIPKSVSISVSCEYRHHGSGGDHAICALRIYANGALIGQSDTRMLNSGVPTGYAASAGCSGTWTG